MASSTATAQARAIRAVYTGETIRVYQAYNDAIADAALKAGRFVDPWKPRRTTWIKPSSIWMGYRSGWGTKDANQARILAIDMPLSAFEWILGEAKGKGSDVVIQWDPERDLGGEGGKQSFTHKIDGVRSLQIGLKTAASARYTAEFCSKITDVTPLFAKIGALLREGKVDEAKRLVPAERLYNGLSEQVGRQIRLSIYGDDAKQQGQKPRQSDQKTKKRAAPVRPGQTVLALFDDGKTRPGLYPAKVTTIDAGRVRVKFLRSSASTPVVSEWLERSNVLAMAECETLGQRGGPPPRVGATVYAKFTEDGIWYHATVEATNGGRLRVRYTDYGNSAEVARTDVFPESAAETDNSKGRPPRKVTPPTREPSPRLADWSAAAEMKKEGGSNFYLSLCDTTVADLMNPILCLYRCCVPARYGGKGGYPTGHLLALIHCDTATAPLAVPRRVATTIAKACFNETKTNFAFEFVWAVYDISEILEDKRRRPRKKGSQETNTTPNIASLNLVHHSWVFPDAAPGQRRSANIPIGVLEVEGSRVNQLLPCPGKPGKGDRDLPIGNLAPCRISVHADKRNKYAMCCSPNNARVYFRKSDPVVAFWSFAVAPGRASDPARVLIQLNFLLTRPNEPLHDILQSSGTFGKLIKTISESPEGLIAAGCPGHALSALASVFGAGTGVVAADAKVSTDSKAFSTESKAPGSIPPADASP